MAVTVDWSILNGAPDVGEQFRKGLQWGRDYRRQGAQDNALAALAQNPNDEQAMAQMAGINPEVAWKMQDRQREQRQYEAEEPARKLEIARKVTDFAVQQLSTVRDQATYDIAKQRYNQTLQQYGLPPQELPPTYSPETVRDLQMQVLSTKEQLDLQSKGNESLQFLTPQDGGVYVGNKRTGAISPGILPNPGDKQPGAPVEPIAGGRPLVKDAQSYDAIPPGQEYTTPDGTIRVKPGGQTSRASGRFP